MAAAMPLPDGVEIPKAKITKGGLDMFTRILLIISWPLFIIFVSLLSR